MRHDATTSPTATMPPISQRIRLSWHLTSSCGDFSRNVKEEFSRCVSKELERLQFVSRYATGPRRCTILPAVYEYISSFQDTLIELESKREDSRKLVMHDSWTSSLFQFENQSISKVVASSTSIHNQFQPILSALTCAPEIRERATDPSRDPA